MNRGWGRILPPITLFIAFLICWQLIATRITAAFWILPAPSDVLNVLLYDSAVLWKHSWPTLVESVTGLVAATLLGIVCALAMHRLKLIKTLVYPYLIVSQTVPVIAIAPLVVLWFGYGISAKIFVTIIVCFFPVALGLYDGLRQVPVEQVRLLKSMGAGQWRVYRLLYLPAALPGLFTGLRLGATYCVMGAVFGEWLGGNAGLGIYLTRSTRTFNTPGVFAAIILIVLISLALFGLVVLLERIFLAWHYKKAEEYEDRAGL